MKKRILFFGIISLVLVFGLVLAGCDTTTSSPPSAPTGIRATVDEGDDLNAGKGIITITWNAVSDATGYEVYVREGVTGAYTSCGTVTNSAATHANRVPGVTYYYKVAAYNSNGQSAQSSTFAYATPSSFLAPIELEDDTFFPNGLTAGGYTHYYKFRAPSTGDYSVAWFDSDFHGTDLTSPIANIQVKVFLEDGTPLVTSDYDDGNGEQNVHYIPIIATDHPPCWIYIDVEAYNSTTSGEYWIAFWKE